MAWSKGRRKAPFRKRRRTYWREVAAAAQTNQRGLARGPNEGPVQSYELVNVYAMGGAVSGTLSAMPLDLTEDADNTSAAREDHPRARILRVVGMFRPIGIASEVEAELINTHLGHEVRYAIVRLNTLREGATWGAGQAIASPLNVNHIDLFSPQGLGNECIAWMRSWLLPTRPTLDPVETVADLTTMSDRVVRTLQWWANNEMTVLDWKSPRSIGQNSKMYLLRQARRYDGFEIDPARIVSAAMYSADYARVLMGGVE